VRGAIVERCKTFSEEQFKGKQLYTHDNRSMSSGGGVHCAAEEPKLASKPVEHVGTPVISALHTQPPSTHQTVGEIKDQEAAKSHLGRKNSFYDRNTIRTYAIRPFTIAINCRSGPHLFTS
jgi:hypothetical protein